MDNEAQRTDDIHIVMKEREEMVKVGQEILTLIGQYPYKSPEPDRLAIQKKLLEFTAHLSNIGGFCDTHWKIAILQIETFLGASMESLNFDMTSAPALAVFLNTAVGTQVDFTKRPFRLIGFDIKAFQARLKAVAKR